MKASARHRLLCPPASSSTAIQPNAFTPMHSQAPCSQAPCSLVCMLAARSPSRSAAHLQPHARCHAEQSQVGPAPQRQQHVQVSQQGLLCANLLVETVCRKAGGWGTAR